MLAPKKKPDSSEFGRSLFSKAFSFSESDVSARISGDDADIHRGLRNLQGQYNCFLNSALQTLWHLPKFRHALANFTPPPLDPGQCVLLPSLQSLFANYRYGEEKVLPPDEVRCVMGSLYSQLGRFKENEIDDAAECLEAILVTIHCEAVGVPEAAGGDDMLCSPICPACAAFRIAFVDLGNCTQCEAVGDPFPRSERLNRVWVEECLQGPTEETFQDCLRRVLQVRAVYLYKKSMKF